MGVLCDTLKVKTNNMNKENDLKMHKLNVGSHKYRHFGFSLPSLPD